MKRLNNMIERFCILHPNVGVPNLMLYIVLGNVAVYVLDMFSRGSGLSALLYFSPALVLQGQLWRVFTFVFVPGGGGLLFLVYCYFSYSMGRTLEAQWGTTKFTVYYLGGALLIVLGSFAVSLLSGVSVDVYSASEITFAMFLAFAVLFPDATFVLFPIPIPIRAKYIAYLDLAYFAFDILAPILTGRWYNAVEPLMALLNVSAMIWPSMAAFLKLDQRRGGAASGFRSVHFTRPAARRDARQEARQANSGVRKCAVCGRTNLSNPELDFRYCSRCAGYHCFCSDHIFSHVHFTEDQP